jgi:cysteine synthase A
MGFPVPVQGALAAIGSTPLVELQRVVPDNSARVLVKLEWTNPTGSMKDRMAAAVIAGAEARGDLRPGGVVVEYTAGTTGVSLAFACAVKGYGLHVVFSDAFSVEKRRTMEAFGAVEDVPSDAGRITEGLIRAMIARAGELAAKPGHWWCDQLNNADAVNGYMPLGEEIWQQTGGRVDAFVHAVSTAHSIHGISRGLRAHRPDLEVVAVEPAESAVLSGSPSGSHRIEGIGIGFVPPLWEPDEVDSIERVSTDEAMTMARLLAAEEGLFAGTSSGANVVAALRLADRLGQDATVVTVAVDSGFRYLSTDLYGARVTAT